MNYSKLKKINKLYFGYEELARTFNIGLASAAVTANRYVKQGFLIRFKRNMYVLSERWDILRQDEKFLFANLGQVPSYISLMTAMGYYDITTQIQRGYIESIALKRSKEINIKDNVFIYSKINTKLYSGFEKKEGIFIAIPEKAFLDAVYLMSINRYSFDLSSIDFRKLDIDKVRFLVKDFPKKTQKAVEEWIS